jgi:hypothetical protein
MSLNQEGKQYEFNFRLVEYRMATVQNIQELYFGAELTRFVNPEDLSINTERMLQDQKVQFIYGLMNSLLSK